MMCQHDVSVFKLYHMGIVAYKDIHIKEHICKTVWENKKWRTLALIHEKKKKNLVNLRNGLQNCFGLVFESL